MARRRPLSLQARQLIAAGLGLVAFLGLTGLALDRAFVEAGETAVRERLRSYFLAYLHGIEIRRDGQLLIPEQPPDPRFDGYGSGLYAAIRGVTAEGEPIAWVSTSALGRDIPFAESLDSGEERFVGGLQSEVGTLYRYAYGVAWVEGEGDSTREAARFTFSVAEHEAALERQVRAFRRALWVYLGGAGVLLLGAQVFALRWSLQPLRRVVRDLHSVESGRTQRLEGRYPRELSLLTENLNAFIEGEREHLSRYRNTLADLAHSLKTPLAVLRTRMEAGADADALRAELREQVDRMDEIVAYQLSRAATSGAKVFAAPLRLEEPAENLVRSLEKVYATKNVLCEFEIDPLARFYGELGDLMELLGNLLENSFKWCDHRVLLTAQAMTIAPQRRAGLLITVDDDGPGIAEDQVERVLQRGVRGDERVHGHGIGLAIVQDIVRAYRGELSIERSTELGGARFVVRFSPAI